MADDALFLPGLSPIAGKPVQITFDAGRLTSDDGVLGLAEVERRLAITERLARCFEDPRAPEWVQHGPAEMIRFRARLIAAGYADASFAEVLRHLGIDDIEDRVHGGQQLALFRRRKSPLEAT